MHASGEQPARRVVHLEVIANSPAGDRTPMVRSVSVTRTAGGLPWMLATRDGWLCLAERTLGDLASTLRAAFLMLVGLAGVIVLIGVAFGFGGVLLGAILSLPFLPAAISRPAVARSSR